MPLSPDPSQPEQAADDTPSSTLAIETHGLSKHFGQRKAVDGLTISIPAGIIAGFIGPNGAGKTTTIRLLLGLVRPSEGHATILGQPLTHPRSYLPRVGALIEAPAFYPSLSGRTNLEVLAHLGGHPRSCVGQLLELVELSDRAKDRDLHWRIKAKTSEELRQEFIGIYVPRIRELGYGRCRLAAAVLMWRKCMQSLRGARWSARR